MKVSSPIHAPELSHPTGGHGVEAGIDHRDLPVLGHRVDDSALAALEAKWCSRCCSDGNC